MTLIGSAEGVALIKSALRVQHSLERQLAFSWPYAPLSKRDFSRAVPASLKRAATAACIATGRAFPAFSAGKAAAVRVIGIIPIVGLQSSGRPADDVHRAVAR